VGKKDPGKQGPLSKHPFGRQKKPLKKTGMAALDAFDTHISPHQQAIMAPKPSAEILKSAPGWAQKIFRLSHSAALKEMMGDPQYQSKLQELSPALQRAIRDYIRPAINVQHSAALMELQTPGTTVLVISDGYECAGAARMSDTRVLFRLGYVVTSSTNSNAVPAHKATVSVRMFLVEDESQPRPRNTLVVSVRRCDVVVLEDNEDLSRPEEFRIEMGLPDSFKDFHGDDKREVFEHWEARRIQKLKDLGPRPTPEKTAAAAEAPPPPPPPPPPKRGSKSAAKKQRQKERKNKFAYDCKNGFTHPGLDKFNSEFKIKGFRMIEDTVIGKAESLAEDAQIQSLHSELFGESKVDSPAAHLVCALRGKQRFLTYEAYTKFVKPASLNGTMRHMESLVHEAESEKAALEALERMRI
jgi:hypothetical protein